MEQEKEELAPMPFHQVLRDTFEDINQKAERGERLLGISTGYERLDSLTNGFHPGELIVLASRPGMGKTALATNIAVNIASPRTVTIPASDKSGANPEEEHEPGFGVVIFSPGMKREQLALRMVGAEGRVKLSSVHNGDLNAEDWRRLTESASYLCSLPIWIHDAPELTVRDILAKTRMVQSEYEKRDSAGNLERRVGLVIVDYMQLIRVKERAQNREEELSEISRDLKAMAMSCDVTVLALSQLNRAVETRMPSTNKRPQVSDLRGSGAIEDDADTLIFIYRDEYYNPDMTEYKGIAELIVAKQRNGPRGRVLTRFTAACVRFDNLAVNDYPELYDED